MLFQRTAIDGVVEIQVERRTDERGFFARSWCRREFEQASLNSDLAQCSISWNPHKYTLRGMHYQAVPYEEAKLVRCTRGAIYDVVVDLRPQSPTFTQWIGVTLTAEGRNMIYIPEGCAHGFLTLQEDCEISYQISQFYCADSARGVRWDDPSFGIMWPAQPLLISERDRTYPDFA
jgi:dTDP-4-dehydrorhamnose 3,5-epimerase